MQHLNGWRKRKVGKEIPAPIIIIKIIIMALVTIKSNKITITTTMVTMEAVAMEEDITIKVIIMALITIKIIITNIVAMEDIITTIKLHRKRLNINAKILIMRLISINLRN